MRSNQAHIPHKHVPQLARFVDFVTADEVANGPNAVIARVVESKPGLSALMIIEGNWVGLHPSSFTQITEENYQRRKLGQQLLNRNLNELAVAKAVVLSKFDALDTAPASKLADALDQTAIPDCPYHFVHPFNDVTGSQAAVEIFWKPVRDAFAPLQRRQDIFFAGYNHLDDSEAVWVISMGHLLGLFDNPFLGIRPTRKATMLRYAEFNCVSDGKIIDSTLFLDIMNLMAQAGAEVLPPSTAATMVTPGPRTHDGLLFQDQPASDGQATLDLFVRMINRLLSVDVHTTNTDLSLDWTEDMIWWGPGGIGAPYTQKSYLEQHCVPFEEGLKWGDFFGHRTEIAEGHYGGFFGWPTFDVTSLGGYIGLAPKSDKKASMRVVDIYRREGDRLAENWNFIDHLHFLDQLGVDLIARQRALTGL